MITLYEVVSFQSPKFFSLSHCNFCLYQVVTYIKRSWSPFTESQWFVCIFLLACIEELLNGIIHGIIQWICFVQMERNICNIFFLSLITTWLSHNKLYSKREWIIDFSRRMVLEQKESLKWFHSSTILFLWSSGIYQGLSWLESLW